MKLSPVVKTALNVAAVAVAGIVTVMVGNGMYATVAGAVAAVLALYFLAATASVVYIWYHDKLPILALVFQREVEYLQKIWWLTYAGSFVMLMFAALAYAYGLYAWAAIQAIYSVTLGFWAVYISRADTKRVY